MAVRHAGGDTPARGYSPLGFENTAVMRPEYHVASLYDSDASTDHESSDSPSGQGTQSTSTTPPPSSEALPDAREHFRVGPPSDLEFPTPYPADDILPNFSNLMRAVYHDLKTTCHRLVEAIEVGLQVPANSICGPTAGADGTEVCLNFYPSVSRDTLQDEANATDDKTKAKAAMRRIWPHTDGGIVTALLQENVGATGLELEVREPSSSSEVAAAGMSDTDGQAAKFAPVTVDSPGDIVLLVSDTLEHWTNGYLRAAVHRVGLPPAIRAKSTSEAGPGTMIPARRSAVLLFRAPPPADLSPLPPFVSAQSPSTYEAMNAEELLRRMNHRSFPEVSA